MTQNNFIGADHLPSPVFSRLSNDDTVQLSTTLPTPLLSRLDNDEELTVSAAPLSPCQCWVGQSTKLAPIPVYCSFSSDEELSVSGPQPQPGRCVPTCYISEN